VDQAPDHHLHSIRKRCRDQEGGARFGCPGLVEEFAGRVDDNPRRPSLDAGPQRGDVDHVTKVPSSPMSGRAMIIVAGGDSSRFDGDKLMTPIAGRPLVVHTVGAVAGLVDICVLVCREDQADAFAGVLPGVTVVPGGPTRTQSEMAGLAALPDEVELIGIHDGARPLVSPGLIGLLFDTAAGVGGAVPVLRPFRPLVRRSDLGPVPGAAVAQTPQVFRAPVLLKAYRAAAASGFEGHDTADVVRAFSDVTIAAVDGEPGNIKVTYPSDLDIVRAALDPSRTGPR